MGLDMYAFSVPADKVGDSQVDFEIPEETTPEGDRPVRHIAYWRKFNHLHGWMERLYREKGGTRDFNCDTVRLTEADLDRLLADTQCGRLTHTPGFFFGGAELHEEDLTDLLAFIDRARTEIKLGNAVFYDSWW